MGGEQQRHVERSLKVLMTVNLAVLRQKLVTLQQYRNWSPCRQYRNWSPCSNIETGHPAGNTETGHKLIRILQKDSMLQQTFVQLMR